MILKKLIQKGYFDINKALQENYVELGLCAKEMVLLMALFSNKDNILSLRKIKERTAFSDTEASDMLASLMKKGFIALEIEYSHDGKEKETYNLDQTLIKLEEIINKANIEEQSIFEELDTIKKPEKKEPEKQKSILDDFLETLTRKKVL